jgi:broad specificity phosphatase PhoE
MSRYLYLVRHGEQVDAEFGLPEGPLSDRGRQQAAQVADRLSGITLMPPMPHPSRERWTLPPSSPSGWGFRKPLLVLS